MRPRAEAPAEAAPRRAPARGWLGALAPRSLTSPQTPLRALPLSLLVLALLALLEPAAVGAPRPAATRPAARPAQRWRPPVRRGYREAIARWHTPTPNKTAPVDEAGRPRLVLSNLNTGEAAELRAASDEGGFDAAALERAAWLLRDPRAGLVHPVEPSLLDVLYRAQRRFSAHEVRVVSGYRAPGARGASNHGRGRAVDFVIPGARDQEVADWARGLGFTGVGLYPNAGYCHVDVRARSHFWVDASGPGQRNREVPVLGAQAQRSDAEARRQHRHPIGPYALPSRRIDEAWKGSAPAAADDHDAEDDAASD